MDVSKIKCIGIQKSFKEDVIQIKKMFFKEFAVC
jgi:hypothetical protein